MSPDPSPLEGRRTPVELDADQFARIGHKLVDEVAELFRTMRERRVGPSEEPRQIRDALGAERRLPDEGTDPEALMQEATRLLVDHSLFNGHPRFFGYITSGAAPLGVLGDMLAAAVNPNVGAWGLSPMATEMEAQAVRWIAELVGFPAGGGVLTSGGGVANMLGFWAGRAAKAGWSLREEGLRGRDARQLRVYGSAGTHTWIQKAADLSGLGTASMRWIETDDRGRIDVSALDARIRADVAAGDVPAVVIGTAGSVATGAVDPLGALREVCDAHGAWLHVDGAYGAFAAAAQGAPEDLQALALADSLALDPHKWLYAPLEAGCVLVRSRDALLSAFSFHPDYYRFEEDVDNYFDQGIQNSRGFRALKVWLILRQVGRAGYARMIAEDMELARRFYRIADAHDELEALTQALSITTFRYVPSDLAHRLDEDAVAEYLNELNTAIQDRMAKSGRAYVSNAVLDGTYALRMCIVNFRTALEDVEALAEITVDIGGAADGELRPPALG